MPACSACPFVLRWTDRDAIWVMAGTQTRIGLWRPRVRITKGRGGVHVHFALHIADADFDAAVERLRSHGYEPEVVRFKGPPTEAGRCTSPTPTATSSSSGRSMSKRT